MGSKIMQPTTTASVGLLIAIAIASLVLWVAYAPCDDPPSHGNGMGLQKSYTQTAIRKDDTTNSNSDKTWMNVGGLPYKIANAPNFDAEWILKDPTVKFFDVYSLPIRTRYSQVHWTGHGNLPLPQEIVERYNGTGTTDIIAIVGYEMDQVRVEKGQEVPVPITWAYNHHFGSFLLGERTNGEVVKMVQLPVEEAIQYASGGAMGHHTAAAAPGTKVWLPSSLVQEEANLQDGDGDYSSAFFSEGNGGESRKSYHSYPKGYAQLIRRPHSFSVTPMQIDTWNRETMNSSKFVPPPPSKIPDYFPKTSNMSAKLLENLADANYNPLLECHCTDRLPKTWEMTYKMAPRSNHQKNAKQDFLDDSTECFRATKGLLSSTDIKETVVDGSNEEGGTCDAVLRRDGSLEVVWKKKKNKNGEVDDDAALDAGDTDLIVGSTPTGSLINATLALNTQRQTVEITLKGPYLEENTAAEERWFGIGFGSNSMCVHMQADECNSGGPYAIIVLPHNDTTEVVERKLDYHGWGKILSSPDDDKYHLEIRSNEIETDQDGKRRRVVRLARPMEGPTEDYYTFKVDKSKLQAKPLETILATGCSSAFGQHCGHQAPDPISFARVDQWQQVWRDGIRGKLGGSFFQKNCADQPVGDLKKQGNPTCALETYQGGLSCCRHDHFLLDANQTIPGGNRLLEYRLKFRFYYQDYIEHAKTETEAATEAARDTRKSLAASHQDLPRVYWQTEMRSGEYDVPECTSKDPAACVHVITSRWKVHQFGEFGYFPKDQTGVELIYAAPHCHAPTCLSMELYNDDTGELLCHVEPLRGHGKSVKENYDEAGFLAIPPCLWSHNPDDGLLPPKFLSHNTTLLSIKRANSTYLHTGEMASWQMRGIFVRESDKNQKESSQIATEERLEERTTPVVSAKRAHGRLRN